MNTVRRRPGLSLKAARMQEVAAGLKSSSFKSRAPFSEGLAGLSAVELALADPRTIVSLAHRDISKRCARVREIKENVLMIYEEARQKLSEIVI